MGTTRSLAYDRSDESTASPMAKGQVQLIEATDEEWADYKTMFRTVGWKKEIPDALVDLLRTDLIAYEMVDFLMKDPTVNITAIQSGEQLIAILEKDCWWTRNGKYIEIQLGMRSEIEEELEDSTEQRQSNGKCCIVL